MAARLYSYTVVGRGRFPLDMLRYDSAWPRTSEAVSRIEGADYQTTSEVDLCSYEGPTLDRWRSFGWYVRDVDGKMPW